MLVTWTVRVGSFDDTHVFSYSSKRVLFNELD